MRKPWRYWTRERCLNIVQSCESMAEFMQKHSNVYRVINRKKWYEILDGNFEDRRGKKSNWTKEKCREEALKYNSRDDFRLNSGGAYHFAYMNKWLDEICSHIPLKRKLNYWTKQKCKEEALKYNSRIDFKQNCGYGYDKSLKNGWMDEICSHMTRMGGRHYKCVYVSIFEDKSVYVGITYSFQERKAAHLNLSGKKLSSVGKYILKTGNNPSIIKLTDYLNFEESVLLESKIFDLFKNSGWNVLNKKKTGGVGGTIFTWDKEKCREEALKYKTRNDFMINSAGAYDAANRHGWLNEITEHMLEYRKHRNYWTRERCEKEYEKYNSITELRKKSSGAFSAAYENGWHEDLKKLI